MNKQELIEKWHERRAKANPYCVNRIPKIETLKKDLCGEFIDDLKQLDEPQKLVLPWFVAEWISFCKNKNKKLGYAIHDCFLRDFLLERFGDDDDRVRWLTDYKNQEILARAWLDGYEVEKEPLYVMPVPHVHYCVEDDHVSFRQGNAQKFTQAELDKYFPDIKQFAVPVDEVEG